MSDVPTVNISAAAYDEALAFCNARLAEDGKPAISRLPPGVPDDPNSCPCASACGVYVEAYYWRGAQGGMRRDGHPCRFVEEFDAAGRSLPDYVPFTGRPILPIRLPD